MLKTLPLDILTRTHNDIKNKMEINWVRKFKEVFDKINIPGTAEYFSGVRFINIIQEFDNSFLNYTDFISHRQSEGLNTGRKAYFYDILLIFEESKRLKIVERIEQEIMDKSLIKNQNTVDIINEPKLNSISAENPKVFISYSWDSEEHKQWVINLANTLVENGVDILLDEYFLKTGKDMKYFMSNSIKEADLVLLILTENYKIKAEELAGGVGFEYSILKNKIYDTIKDNNRFFPIIRKGSFTSSIPDFMGSLMCLDMRQDKNFEEKVEDLLRDIYNERKIKKPPLGKKPNFNSDKIEDPLFEFKNSIERLALLRAEGIFATDSAAYGGLVMENIINQIERSNSDLNLFIDNPTTNSLFLQQNVSDRIKLFLKNGGKLNLGIGENETSYLTSNLYIQIKEFSTQIKIKYIPNNGNFISNSTINPNHKKINSFVIGDKSMFRLEFKEPIHKYAGLYSFNNPEYFETLKVEFDKIFIENKLQIN